MNYTLKFKTIEHPGNQMLAENGKWSSIILIGAKGKSLEYENDFPNTFDLLKNMPINEHTVLLLFKIVPKDILKLTLDPLI